MSGPHWAPAESPIGGGTPNDPLALSTITTPGDIVGGTTNSLEPGQRRPVGGTTGTSPDSASDSTLTGTVGGTTDPLSLLEYTEDTLDQNLGSTTAITSPATSTPGTTPIRNKNGELIKSDLQRSNESKIGDALIIEEEDISPVEKKRQLV